MSSDDPCLDHVDWNSVWKERKARNLSTRNYLTGDEFWNDPRNVQLRYGNTSLHAERVKRQLSALVVPEGGKVLDIGSGPGTLAVPLAKAGCDVCAVEPSTPMVRALEEYRKKENAREIRVIQKRWEDVDPEELDGPFDLVVASFSLTMLDMGESAEKMDRVSNGGVYLFWFLTPPLWARMMEDLWQPVHGSPYFHEPMADCLFQLLLQKGIYPNISLEKVCSPHPYETLGEAVDDFRRQMNAYEPRQESLIRNYLRTHLTMSRAGLCLRGDSWNAMIWWKKPGPGR